MKSSIKLINHASAKINIDGISIISDPWYNGSVFHRLEINSRTTC